MSLKLIWKSIKRGSFLSGLTRRYIAVSSAETIRVHIEKALCQPEEKASLAVEKILRRFFGITLKQKGLSYSYRREVAALIAGRRTFGGLVSDNYEALIAKTNNLDPRLLCSNSWKKFCYILYSNGCFRLAYSTRGKMIASIYAEADKLLTGYKKQVTAFNAAKDQGDHDRIEKYYLRLKRKQNSDRLKSYEYIYYLHRGELEKSGAVVSKLYSGHDCKFANYLAGKSVAVVGPAPTGEENAAEIDSFDVVVRINYGGNDRLPDVNEFGRKVDVAYYNNECSDNINEMEDMAFFNDVDYAVFKSIKYHYQKKILSDNRGRQFYSPQELFVNGGSNMIPNILYDLMYFRPDRIKLFKVNFYLSSQAYYEGYQIAAKTDQSKKRAWYLFALHDPISQLNFVKSLWNAGLIEADDACQKALHLDSKEYITRLEGLYL